MNFDYNSINTRLGYGSIVTYTDDDTMKQKIISCLHDILSDYIDSNHINSMTIGWYISQRTEKYLDRYSFAVRSGASKIDGDELKTRIYVDTSEGDYYSDIAVNTETKDYSLELPRLLK